MYVFSSWPAEVHILLALLLAALLGVSGLVVAWYRHERRTRSQWLETQQDALKRFHKMAARMPGVLYEFRLRPDGTACFPYCSEALGEMYEHRISPEDVREDGSKIFALIHPDDLPQVTASIGQSAQNLTLWLHEYRINLGPGRLRWLLGNAMPEREADGSVVWYGFISDITERKQAEQQVHELNRDFVSFLDNTSDFVYFKDKDSRFRFCSQTLADITGHAHWRDMLGKHDFEVFPAETAQIYYDEELPIFRDAVPLLNRVDPYFDARGNKGWVSTNKWPLLGLDGRVEGLFGISRDITSNKEHQQELEHIAHYDALTQLPNRVLLADRLRQALLQTQRRGNLMAVVFVDLDGFKAVNDEYGHEAGDQLLISVSTAMKQTLREGDTLARIGGDEFVAVLIDLLDVTSSLTLFNRLLLAAAQPVPWGAEGEVALQVSASLGVTFYPQVDENVEADLLLRQADQAMYAAKQAGKNRYQIFDTEQERNIRSHHESLEHIRQGLQAHEFVLHYQPKVNMRTGEVVGAEALIRWQHPQRGLLAPAAFLSVIEEHALAIDVGEWVIDTALMQIERWQALGLNLPVSVNVGARQLQQVDFVPRLCAILARHPQVNPSALELEVLETSALDDVVGVSRVIQACGELGVLFALDDFGTGYSSLTYLKRLPVTFLKIDQSFVRDMLDNPNDLAILESVIGLANAFGRQVVAEGVETIAHGTLLLQLGCELAQGYGIARPMPTDALPDWVKTWKPDPAWIDIVTLQVS